MTGSSFASKLKLLTASLEISKSVFSVPCICLYDNLFNCLDDTIGFYTKITSVSENFTRNVLSVLQIQSSTKSFTKITNIAGTFERCILHFVSSCCSDSETGSCESCTEETQVFTENLKRKRYAFSIFGMCVSLLEWYNRSLQFHAWKWQKSANFIRSSISCTQLLHEVSYVKSKPRNTHQAREGRIVFLEIVLFALASPAMHETPSLKSRPRLFRDIASSAFPASERFSKEITLEFRCAIKTQCFAVHEPRTTFFPHLHTGS